jgi:ribulose-5-phosphate 4-epimerase/fuculose-1-phosphate aldolase
MRAVECRRGNLTLISTEHARVFEKISQMDSYPVSKMSERERQLAEELYQMDVLDQVGEGSGIGFRVITQRKIL